MKPAWKALIFLILSLTSFAGWGYTLSGTVYGGSNPLANAVVKAVLSSDKSDAGQTTTDSSGHYSLNIGNGTYILLITPPVGSGFASAPVNGIVVSSADLHQDVVLVSGARVYSGIVRGLGGVALPGVSVQAYDVTGTSLIADSRATETGSFYLPLASGSYRIQVYGSRQWGLQNADGSWVNGTWPAGSPSNLFYHYRIQVSNQDLVQDVQIPFVELRGRTADGNGVPVGGVAVTTSNWSWSGDSQGLTIGYWYINHNNGSVVSGSDGQYSMWLLAPYSVGTSPYTITAVAPPGSGLSNTPANNVNITSELRQTLDLTLQSAHIYSGIVRGLGGVALPGVSVQAYDVTGTSLIADSRATETGSFYLPLASGSYRIQVYGSRQWGLQNADGSWVNGTWPAGSPSNLFYHYRIQVSNQDLVQDVQIPFVELRGRTADGNGVPVGGVAVTTSNWSWSGDSQGLTIGYWYINHNNGSVVSGSDGQYSMWLLAPYSVGTSPYTITIVPPPLSHFSNTPINNLSIVGNQRLDGVLALNDVTAPLIISGPLVTKISSNNASIIWQTDEPAKGSVAWTGGSITETDYVTQHAILMDKLTPSTLYTITISVTDQSGNGPTTATVSFTTAAEVDHSPPVIVEGPTISAITSNQAIAEWETNKPATTEISGDITNTVPGYSTSHKVLLSALSSNHRYNIVIGSTDSLGNGPTTRNVSFTTSPTADVTPPIIRKGPWFVDITSNSATVVWETDELSKSGVSYNDGTAYGVLNDVELELTHSVRMTGLQPNTTYHVTVSSKDAFGNGPTLSSPFDIKTLGLTDTDAPVFLEQPSACNINQRLVQICFQTDEPSNILIEYGTNPNQLTKTEARAQLIRKHAVPINGLNALTNYYFKVHVKDGSGNERVSDIIQATTLAESNGNPSFVTAPSVSYQSKDKTVISWETNRPSSAMVEYGIGNFDLQATDGQLKTKHSIVLPKLAPNNTYQFRVTATDVDGNKITFGF